MKSNTPVIRLRKNEHRRVLQGHSWVFANEIGETEGAPEQGAIVAVQDAAKNFLGIGFYNKTSLIAVRLLSRADETVDADFFTRRLETASRLREQLFPGSSAYRLIHGESDFLPGLTIDRFGDTYAVQILSAGMQNYQDTIVDLLVRKYAAKCVIAKNESHYRTLEGLERETKILAGEGAPVEFAVEGIRYEIDISSAQKTGFYFDQRENRKALDRFSYGARVLDCYCNAGGFALHAAGAGAREVIGVDSSAQAIAAATRNAALNGAAVCSFIESDVEERLHKYADAKEKFDVVILDPPAFAKNKKSVNAALRAYKSVNTLAMLLLNPGGVLATATCSHHISRDAFTEIAAASAAQTNQKIQILEYRGASPDHPVLPAMPETEYLKFVICRLVGNGSV